MRNLRELRLKKGVSQKEVAKEIGMSRYTVMKLENGDVGNPSTVRKLADYYGVDPLSICDCKDIVRKEFLPKNDSELVVICRLILGYKND